MNFEGKTEDDIREFLARGGNLDARENGLTPLHRAIEAGDDALVQHLLDAGADPNARSGEDEDPPLVVAMNCVDRNRAPMLKILLSAGADPNLQNDRGVAALHLSFGDTGLIRDLVRAGADPDLLNERYGRPLHWAVANISEMEAVRGVCGLIGAGADPDAQDAAGWRPVHRLFTNIGHDQALHSLLTGGADPNGTDAEGRTPLHWDASRPYIGTERMRILVAAGADPNKRCQYGKTPLHEAVDRGGAGAVQFLLEAGADPEVRDNDGASAHDILARREARPVNRAGEREECAKLRALFEGLGKEGPEPTP